MNDTDADAAARRLFEAFGAFGRHRGRRGFAHHERPAEFRLLHRLSHEDDGLRLGDIAQALGVRPPTASQLVDALERRGLVERAPDGEDRRAVRIRLSAEGRALGEAFRARALAEARALTDHLGVAEAERLAELLGKATAFLASRPSPWGCPGEARADGHDSPRCRERHGKDERCDD